MKTGVAEPPKVANDSGDVKYTKNEVVWSAKPAKRPIFSGMKSLDFLKPLRVGYSKTYILGNHFSAFQSFLKLAIQQTKPVILVIPYFFLMEIAEFTTP
ncbi:MAG: hypothetical protein D6816_10360 [Bacteroidetes bacterium]|nr:MAG: hypothetical protein D6816_10360 [Bacteroidota bacterium]